MTSVILTDRLSTSYTVVGFFDVCFLLVVTLPSESREGETGSFALLWIRAVGSAAMQMCLTARNETLLCRAGITHNVCV